MEALSINKLTILGNILKDKGFVHSDSYKATYRYSVEKDPECTVILGAKLPIHFPIDRPLRPELVCFYPSLSFRPQWFDEVSERQLETTADLFMQFISTLPTKYPYRYDFHLDNLLVELDAALEPIFPDAETIRAGDLDYDHRIYNYLRSHQFQQISLHNPVITQISQDIFEVLPDFDLHPYAELPPELVLGIPKDRKDWVVFFTNKYSTEFLMAEPGSLTFWCDYVYRNIWLRCGFESHLINLLYQIVSLHSPTPLRFSYLYFDWIAYCRGLLYAMMKDLLNDSHFEKIANKSFSFVPYLSDYLAKQPAPGVFLPNIVFDLSSAKQPRDLSFFDHPPHSLEETACQTPFFQAKDLVRRGKFQAAIPLLDLILPILTKHDQLIAQFTVHMVYAQIGKQLHQYSLMITHLKAALDLIKSGLFSADEIVELYIQLIYGYEMNRDFAPVQTVLDKLFTFIKGLPEDLGSERLFLKVHAFLARFRMQQSNFDAANAHLLELQKHLKSFPEYDFLYYFERAHYYEHMGTHGKTFQAMQKAAELLDGSEFDHYMLKYDFGRFYLHQRNDPSRAIKELTELDSQLTQDDFEILMLRLKITKLLMDAYKAKKDMQTVIHWERQMKEIQQKIER